MISIVVPIYNEEEMLHKQDIFLSSLSKKYDIIFVDGGSSDKSISIAQKYGQVLKSKKGRAVQMNLGAKHAQHDILFFLHVDTWFSISTLCKINEAIKNKKLDAGCLTQKIDHPSPIYKWIAWTGNIRAKLTNVYFGDQGIFIKKEIFNKLGGFPEVSIGEDVLFTRKVKKETKNMKILKNKIFCSARRWEKLGLWKTFFLNRKIMKQINEMKIDSSEYSDVR